MKSMAVFDAPPVPGCWRGGEVIRIVDPLGLQVAWVSPALAGGIVGYYARESMNDAWTEVLTCSSAAGRDAGSALLLRDAGSGQMMPAQGTDAEWTFASRDPTQTTVSGRINDHELSVSLQCADGELHIEITADKAPSPLSDTGLRVHLGAAVGALIAETSGGGELAFRGGVLEHLTMLHSTGLACQVQLDSAGDHQVDLVPIRRLPAGAAGSPVSITLVPLASRRETTTSRNQR